MSQYQIVLNQRDGAHLVASATGSYSSPVMAEEALDEAIVRGSPEVVILRDGSPISAEVLRSDAKMERDARR